MAAIPNTNKHNGHHTNSRSNSTTTSARWWWPYGFTSSNTPILSSMAPPWRQPPMRQLSRNQIWKLTHCSRHQPRKHSRTNEDVSINRRRYGHDSPWHHNLHRNPRQKQAQQQHRQQQVKLNYRHGWPRFHYFTRLPYMHHLPPAAAAQATRTRKQGSMKMKKYFMWIWSQLLQIWISKISTAWRKVGHMKRRPMNSC